MVSILRGGDALAEAAQACIPHAPVGKVSSTTTASLQGSLEDMVEAGNGCLVLLYSLVDLWRVL